MIPHAMDFKKVAGNDTIRFHCSGCGECCRNLKNSAMLESLDVFRLARHFKELGHPGGEIDYLISEYAEVQPINESGYPIFFLKTVGEKEECVFLKDGRCNVYSARPRTCRLYPLSVGPGDKSADKNKSDFDYYLSLDRTSHLTGDAIRVSDWMCENFDSEAKAFIAYDYSTLPEIGKLVRKLKEPDLKRLVFVVMLYRYYEFDTAQDFMPQYMENTRKLRKVLIDMIRESEQQ